MSVWCGASGEIVVFAVVVVVVVAVVFAIVVEIDISRPSVVGGAHGPHGVGTVRRNTRKGTSAGSVGIGHVLLFE